MEEAWVYRCQVECDQKAVTLSPAECKDGLFYAKAFWQHIESFLMCIVGMALMHAYVEKVF